MEPTKRKKLRNLVGEDFVQKWEELERELDRLEAELERTEEWEPEGGDYYVSTTGNIGHLSSEYEGKAFGTERPTFSQAEQARDLMRTHNRALAYVQEHAPDYEFIEHDAYAVESDERDGWELVDASCKPIGAVIGPQRVMQKLADDLNSGRVKL